MRQSLLLLLLTTLLAVQGKPGGFYHQEAEYHSSAASYKNNELQHQNNDDSFYAEHGDIGRKTKPKINSYSQHSEYVNPKLRNGDYAQTENFDTSAFGSNLDHQDTYGQSGYDSYNQGSYRNQAHASLQELTRQLQSDLSRQLQNAISNQYRESASYSHSSSSSYAQMQQDIQDLEQELKANLTRRLQEALHRQYGQQRTQGLNSYSQTSGNVNYNNQELNDLKQQVESNLLRQLQQGVRSQYETQESRSGYSSSVRSNSNYPAYSSHPSSGVAPLSADSQTRNTYQTNRDSPYYPDQTSYSSSNSYASSYRQTLTNVVANVQNDLSQQINEILDEEEEKNRRLIQQGVKPDYDQTFEYLRDVLKRNITEQLQDELRRKYGQQVQRDSQFYSVSGSGSSRSQPNYSNQDLQSLKQQIEDNLVEKLSYGLRQQKSRYDELKSHYISLHGGSTDNRRTYQNNYPTTSSYNRRYDYPDSYQTDSPQPVIPLNSASHTSSGYRNNYNRQQTVGYETNPNSEVELHNIQQQLQNQLSRQIQTAIREQRRQYNEYSSSESRPNYHNILQELTDELKRNLTEKLQQSLSQHYGTQRTMGSQSFSVSSGGSVSSSANYDSEQLNDVRSELQENLIRQLQEGLRQSFNRQRSNSGAVAGVKGGHSSYSSYGAAGGYAASSRYSHGGYAQGQVRSGAQMQEEDCEDGDERYTRRARDVRRADIEQTSQEADDLEGLTQKAENDFLEQQSQWDNTDDLTQKVEDEFANGNYGFGALQKTENHYESNYQQRETQNTQSQRSTSYSPYGWRPYRPTVDDDDKDLTQKSEDMRQQTQRIQSQRNTSYRPYGWSPYRPSVDDDKDLTQKSEDDFRGLQTGSHRSIYNSTNHTHQEDLTQKTEDASNGYYNRRAGSTIPVYSLRRQSKKDSDESNSSEELVQYSVNTYPSYSQTSHKQHSEESKSNESSEEVVRHGVVHNNRGYLQAYPQKKKDGDESGSNESSNESRQKLVDDKIDHYHYTYPLLRQPNHNSDESNSNSDESVQKPARANRLSSYSLHKQNSDESDSSDSSEHLVQRTVDNQPGHLSSYNLRQNTDQDLQQRTVDDKLEQYRLQKQDSQENKRTVDDQQRRLSYLQRQQMQNSDEDLQQRTVDDKLEKYRLQNQDSLENSDDLVQKTVDGQHGESQASNYYSRSQYRQNSSRSSNQELLTQKREEIFGPPARYDLLSDSQNKQKDFSSELYQNTENVRNYQYQRSSSYDAAQESQEKYSSFSQASNAPVYGSAANLENLDTSDSVQKPIEPKHTYAVQDLTQQAQIREVPAHELQNYNFPEENTTEIEIEPSTQPGFWKRLGNKFESAYKSVKHAAISLKDKIVT